MASQEFDLGLKVKLEDQQSVRKTGVITSLKDPFSGNEVSHKQLVQAPPSQGQVSKAVGDSIRTLVDRGLGLVDVSKFKSQHKAEDELPDALGMSLVDALPEIKTPFEKQDGKNDVPQPQPPAAAKPAPAPSTDKPETSKGKK